MRQSSISKERIALSRSFCTEGTKKRKQAIPPSHLSSSSSSFFPVVSSFPPVNADNQTETHQTAPDRTGLEQTQSGHTAAVYVAKFSPRDSLVASAGFDRTLRLWEGTYPYSQVACLEGHRQLISDLCWAPDCRSLLSASFDQVSAVVSCCATVVVGNTQLFR